MYYFHKFNNEFGSQSMECSTIQQLFYKKGIEQYVKYNDYSTVAYKNKWDMDYARLHELIDEPKLVSF